MARLRGEGEEEVRLPRRGAGPVSRHFLTDIVWFNAAGFLALHAAGLIGVVAGLLWAKLLTDLWAFLLLFLTGQAVVIGAHRLYAHRAFKAAWVLRLAIVLLHTMAGQNSLYEWVRDHRQHHRYSDTHADPHNIHRGFFFSHVGWLMMRKHPLVVEKGRAIDMSDIEEDLLVMLQKKYYKFLYVICAFLVPVGVPVVLFGENIFTSIWVCFFARYVALLNITWSVNSLAHIYGCRPYHKGMMARDHPLVACLTWGEGWHNFHHCFPYDYRPGELGWVLDVSGRLVELLERWGLASDLRTASPAAVLRRAVICGDGSHPAAPTP
ncbi:acyl-CoA Delta12-desaturase-like [Bacillus rossius redtenbacheri]|uniref:acyl-CoA Delta12-desaturase-like n=1 Tax=Bacillus rossius redtenbacheri TaxID=93214 RepID=UPI002FDEDDAE